MNFEELIVLLPCHSLEDFPLYHEGDEAEGLLAAWSALWHPALIANVHKAPVWHRVDAPPAEVARALLVVPPIADERLPVGFVTRAQDEHAVLIRHTVRRAEILDIALDAIGGPGGVDPDLAADFLALGYCRLQVELLTRQMRYASNLDQPAFDRQLVSGAEAATRGDADEARTQLTGCFNLLNEARKYFYPVDSYLIDLTLVASTTLEESLAAELRRAKAGNILLPAALLSEMALSHPETLRELRGALDHCRVSVVSGDRHERELPLLPLETMRAEIVGGADEFQRVLGSRPLVFGRRRYGLVPTLPKVLHKLGFQGALHCTLDDGRFPLGTQSKVRWEGDDATAIDALARLPRDAAKPETFLDFARRMGEAMDTDHVATVVFAHWPGLVSTWFDDMRRIAGYTTALGQFITLDEYFGQTYAPGTTARFLPDEYRSPYLKQAIIRRQADSLSTFVQAHRQQAQQAVGDTIAALAALVGNRAAMPVEQTAPREDEQADLQTGAELEQALGDFAAVLPRSATPAVPASLVVNPLSFTRRVLVQRSSAEPTSAADTQIAAADRPEQMVVEVPAMGFAFVDWSATSDAARKRDKPLAEENTLRNEFFEVTIHPAGGGIQIIRDYGHRGNRLSQQIALRKLGGTAVEPGQSWRDPDEDAVYSSMQAESVEVTQATPMVGEITSRGSLLDAEGQKVAGFVQRTQVWRGSRLIRIEIELDSVQELRSDPWNWYYAARFAWSDATADVFRGVHGGRHATDAKRIEAPEYIEIDSPQGRTSILTGGLPYHRRSAMRIIDSLLIVRGETARKFQLAIGVDVPNPAAAAADLLAPPAVWHQTMSPPAGAGTGWFFHIDARSVIATHWAPLLASEGGESADLGSQTDSSAHTGFRVRLLETSGRPVRATVRAFRSLASARKVDFRGQPLDALVVEEDRIVCELAGHDWIEIEAHW